MNEEKKNKRGWVKTAAIVFLSVLLVLTFFSNTIMNATLPEVAVRYVQSGSINVQIRGTGTVKATETYNVTVDESRKVRSVNVSLGDEVSVGDLLMVLSDESSEELVRAEAELKEAKRAYELLMYDTSVRSASRNLSDAKEELAAAEKILANVADYDAAVAEAEARVKDAQTAVNGVNSRIKALLKSLAKFGVTGDEISEDTVDTLRDKLADNSDEVRVASAELELAAKRYKTYYDNVLEEAKRIITLTEGYQSVTGAEEQKRYVEDRLDVYMADEYEKILNDESALTLNYNEWEYRNGEYTYAIDPELKDGYTVGYKTYKDALDKYNEAVKKYAVAKGDELPEYIALCEKLMAEETTANEELKDAQGALSELRALDNDTLTQLKRAVTDAQTSYNLASFNYSNSVNDAKARVAAAEADVAKYSGVQTGTEIHSEINGVIKAINVSSGGKTDPGASLISIEVPDRGYTAEMSVTVDQAQRVMVGDFAQVQIGWWWGGRDITARLIAIRTDPQNARTNRILVFDISGSDVNSGDNLTLTIGERSRSFDTIVPKSAMRSDSNGDFVLMVVARSSPIGNRYTAQRIDVTKLAEDDVNVAVSGDLSYNDAVITTTTAPIENGMQIRMAGN